MFERSVFKMFLLGNITLFLLVFSATAELPADYESKTAGAKLDLLVEEIKAGEGSRGEFPSAFGYMKFALLDDISPTCDLFSDLLPYDHDKRIHSVGTVAAMEFESNGDHPYTGMFQGTPHALVRLSLAAKPSTSTGTTPGLAVKFLRDGMPSANFVAMFSLEGQASGNFFENSFSNHIEAPTGIVGNFLGKKFADVSSPPTAVGLSDIASYTIEGDKIEDPIFPAELLLVPNEELQQQFVNVLATGDGFEETMLSIPAGTKLYDVLARATPSGAMEPIGSMKITSKLMFSRFGDGNLFFRHQRLDDDLELRPEWKADLLEGSRRMLRVRCPLGLDSFDED